MVYNGSQEFKISNWVSAFMFSTLDGTISGWSQFSPNLALIGVSSPGAVYTGLAITNKTSGNTLYAADAANNKGQTDEDARGQFQAAAKGSQRIDKDSPTQFSDRRQLRARVRRQAQLARFHLFAILALSSLP